ncbi:hypothetical protein CVT26_014476 [Gymnopilus dilepis]|uniref:Uncharacterized protein n=1 Tax=Gymnopilus dilepis TaxID=231916 RepID=A0A409VVE4_9AGAR|nr:hypothetical protein CVT26_014476 [Gymnopilus dilepis]
MSSCRSRLKASHPQRLVKYSRLRHLYVQPSSGRPWQLSRRVGQVMSFFRNRHGQADFFEAGNSFSSPYSFSDSGWSELDSNYVTCHHPEECPECANYEEHLEFSALSIPTHHPSGPPTQPATSSFAQGVATGRHLQREDDDHVISRYRSRLHYAQSRYAESVRGHASYRAENELLRRELTAVKDRLLAVQMAYEDLAMARLDDHGYFPAFAGGSGTDTSSRRSEPFHVPASDSEDDDVPRVVREARQREAFEPGRYFVDDDDEFEAFQQLRHMENKEEWEHDFWSDLRPRSISTDSSDEDPITSSSSDTDTDSSSSSESPLSSVKPEAKNGIDPPSSTPNFVPSSHSPPPDALPSETATPSSAAVLDDIAQLSALMTRAHQNNHDGAEALRRIKAFIKLAERIPKARRTSAQLYLLAHWRGKRKSPPRSDTSSPPLPSASPSPSPPSTAPAPSRYDQLFETSAPELAPSQMFVDASRRGIGLIYYDRWLAWEFTPDHPAIPRDSAGSIVMSWAELIAVELGLLTFLSNPAPSAPSSKRTFLIRSDNYGVVNALVSRTWSSSYGLASILDRILKRAEISGVEVVAKWISTKANPADGPSRGVFPPKEMMLDWAPEIHELRDIGLDGVVNLVVGQ